MSVRINDRYVRISGRKLTEFVYERIKLERRVKIERIPEKYRLIKVLQQNEFSAVVLAENERLLCKRIIKIINRKHPYYESLIREAKILQNFRNEAIPIIYDVLEEESEAYLEEEYIEGESLKNYLRRQTLISVNELLTFSIQLCDILIYIHKPNRRVYHLDIKPENILVSDNQLKLVDFGSAISEKDQKSNLEIFGTPGFCAPEQKCGGQISVQTDIYAMGRTFLYMFSYVEEQIPKAYRQVVDNCLRKGQKQYDDANMVREDLVRIKPGLIGRHRERWIGVTGVPTDYNSSAYALLLSLKKAKKGKKVLLLDCNEAHNLEQDKGLYTESGSRNLTFVKKVLPQELRGFRGRGYDFIVCDFGIQSPFLAGLPFDDVVIVGEMSPWTMRKWKEKLSEPDKNTRVKVVAEQSFDFASEWFENRRVIRVKKKYSRALFL